VGIDRLASTVGNSLDMAVAGDGERIAVIGPDRRLTYRELDAAVEAAAVALYGLGLRRGARLAVSLPNTTDIVVLFHAAMRLGSIWVGVNVNLAPPEKEFMIGDSGASILVATAEVIDGLATTRGLVAKTSPQDVGIPGTGALEGDYPRPGDLFDEPAGIAYTSGTTGRPKGVIHSHRNLLLPGAVLIEARGYDSNLRRGDCAALTILNLQVTSTLLAAQAGGTQIVMDRVDPVGIADWIEREQINSWFGVPTMLHGLASDEEVKPSQLESLEDIWTGGAELPTPIRSAFERKFNRRVYSTYGLTEVPTVVAIEPREGLNREGSSGQVLPHLVVEIVDAGGALPSGKEGEIVVSGATSGPWGGAYRPMLGYRNHPRVNSPAGEARLSTGDLGLVDDDGSLHVKGRRTSLILRGGSNVYPAEVERVILEVPGVIGVSVVGYPDEHLGQRVGAAVELNPDCEIDEEVILAHCRVSLARYKIPQRWIFKSLPRNAMGKVLRPDVEAWFGER
jgi:acyl-CoA synthetase (AMP-forming)/AMP-acid ligase II